MADVLLVVLVADASQNAMTGGYSSVAEGVILVSTLVGWNYLLDWLSFRVRAIERFVEPPAHLREAGIESLQEVKSACLESDGRLSVIRVKADDAPSTQDTRSAGR